MTRSARSIAVTLLIWFAGGAVLAACPVCFQIEDGPVSDGVRAAVVVLMGVTVSVLGGFAVCIVKFVRRNPGTAEPRNR